MVYDSVTYEFMSLYLKLLHLYIKVWRPTRHSFGWAI